MKGYMRRNGGALVLGMAAVLMSACATSGGYAPQARYADAATHGGRHATRRVVIENHSWDHVTIYLLTESGATLRLGDVEAMNQASFPIAQTLSEDGAGMRFMAHPLAGSNFSSEGFLFPYGSTAVWTIENHYALSNVRVN